MRYLLLTLVLACAACVAFSTAAQAQYGYGYGCAPGYGYGYGAPVYGGGYYGGGFAYGGGAYGGYGSRVIVGYGPINNYYPGSIAPRYGGYPGNYYNFNGPYSSTWRYGYGR